MVSRGIGSIQVVRLRFGNGREIRGNILTDFFEVRLGKSFNAVAMAWSLSRITGTLYLRAILTASMAL